MRGGQATVWVTAISVSALAPHAAPVALGLAAAKEVFDFLHARMHRTTVLSYIRATNAGTYLSVDPAGPAPGVVLQTAALSASQWDDREGDIPVLTDKSSRDEADLDPAAFCIKQRADWLAYALAHARNVHDAEDAVSHVVEKILLHHAATGRFCPPKYDDPVAWSKRVIANYINDLHRRAAVQRRHQAKLYTPPDDSGEDVLDRLLLRQALHILQDLKPVDHQIALMRYVENLEPRDIAQRLGMKAVTVRTSLWRTNRKIRGHLGIAAESPVLIPRRETS